MSKNQKSYCGMLIKEKMLSQLLKLNKEQLKNVMDSCIHYFKGENTDIPKLDQIEEMICSMMFEDIRDNKINYISSCLEKRKASWKTHHKERIENGEIKDEYLKDFLLEYLKDLDIFNPYCIEEYTRYKTLNTNFLNEENIAYDDSHMTSNDSHMMSNDSHMRSNIIEYNIIESNIKECNGIESNIIDINNTNNIDNKGKGRYKNVYISESQLNELNSLYPKYDINKYIDEVSFYIHCNNDKYPDDSLFRVIELFIRNSEKQKSIHFKEDRYPTKEEIEAMQNAECE